MIIILFLGLSLSLFGAIFLVYTNFKNKKFEYLNEYSQINRKISHIKRYFLHKKIQAVEFSKREKYYIFLIALVISGTSRNIVTLPRYMFFGILLGAVSILYAQKIRQDSERRKKLKEIATFFEATELYMKAGYNIYQAIKAANALTDKIKPSVEKCLSYWGAGPKKALEKLQEELDLPEAETLTLILIHLENTGMKEMGGVIKRETFSMERLQKMKFQVKMANRPVIFTIYRILPLVTILGMVVGTLLFRAFNVIQNSSVINFKM